MLRSRVRQLVFQEPRLAARLIIISDGRASFGGGKKDTFSFSTPSRGLFYFVLPLATKEQVLCGRTLKLLQVQRSRRVFFPFSRRQSRSAVLIRASGYLGGPPVAACCQTFSLITHRERRVSGGGIARMVASV